MHVGYTLPMKSKTGVEIFGHVFNLFGAKFIQDAVDNSEYNSYKDDDGNIANPHSADAAEVFMGLPTTFNLGVKISIR